MNGLETILRLLQTSFKAPSEMSCGKLWQTTSDVAREGSICGLSGDSRPAPAHPGLVLASVTLLQNDLCCSTQAGPRMDPKGHFMPRDSDMAPHPLLRS